MNRPPGDGLALGVPPALIEAVAARAAELTVGALAEAEEARSRVEAAGDGRITLTLREAAAALGVSVDHFDRHVLPNVRIVRLGRKRLVAVAELTAFVERTASRTLREDAG